MFGSRKENKYLRTYTLPSTKLRNVVCVQCKHQFFLQDFLPLRGLVPLLLECGHVICDKCAKPATNIYCVICNIYAEPINEQNTSLPLSIYTLGLMVISHNRPVNMDNTDFTFVKSNSPTTKQLIQGLCHECGIQATIKCPQCNALYCFLCYNKIHGKALQSHSKIMLSSNEMNNSFKVQNICLESCKEPLGYYCENCKITGCSHCMLRLHKKHSYKSLLEKNQEVLSEFYSMTERVSENLQRIYQAQKELSTRPVYQTDTTNINNVESAVTQHFARLHGILQNIEKQIVDSLDEHRNASSKNLNDLSNELKKMENELKSALMTASYMSDNLDKVDIGLEMEKFKKLVDIPCYLVLNGDPGDQEVKFSVDKDIIDIIKKHYTLEMSPAIKVALKHKNALPEDYKIKPVVEEIKDPVTEPKRIKSEESLKMVQVPTSKPDKLLAVGSTETVHVSHVINPSCFYVQLLQNQNTIIRLEKGLAELVETAGLEPTKVTLNALYVVQYSKNNAWYRARVLEKTVSGYSERYRVFFIDHGMEERNVPLSRFRNIEPNYAILPVMAIRCSLHEIVPKDGKWHPDAIKAFEKLVYTNNTMSIHIMLITGDTYYVDLTVVSSMDWRLIHVKDSLTYMKYATCVSLNKLKRTNPDSSKCFYKEYLELETYTDVIVLHVVSPNSIYVRKLHGNRTYFNNMIREMNETYDHLSSFSDFVPTPCKDMPCAARGLDSTWHRGIIHEVTENTVRVFYVDLGYMLTLNHSAVRSLPMKFMTCNTQAIEIALKDLKPPIGGQWDPITIDYLNSFLTKTKQFKIIAFSMVGDKYNVAMYSPDRVNVAQMLRKSILENSVSIHNKLKKKRGKPRKNVSQPEIDISNISKPVTSIPCDVSVKDRSMEESEDPFKVLIEVHHAQSPDCIYVSSSSSNEGDIEQMMLKMQQFYKKYQPEKVDNWEIDDICAVYSLKNDTYYRGRIVDIKSPEKVQVFLYDVGMADTVTLNEIQTLHQKFFETPTYVFRVRLTGILPCGGSTSWPSFSCEKLQTIISSRENCKFYMSKLEEEDGEDTAIPVELWVKQMKVDGPLAPTRCEINSINRLLVEEGVALPIKEYSKKRDKILAIELEKLLTKKLKEQTRYDTSKVKWFEIDSDQEISFNSEIVKTLAESNCDSPRESLIELKSSDAVPFLLKRKNWLPAKPILEDKFIATPTYLNDAGFLYLHPTKHNGQIIRRIEDKLEAHYKNRPPKPYSGHWVAGDPCIALYHANNQWYRGKVLSIKQNGMIEVEFVDYGNVEDCTPETVRRNIILENIPIQCTKCLVEGMVPNNVNGEWTTKELDRIHAHVIEQKCEVTVLDRRPTYLVISLTLFPNKFCEKKIDLISFLTNELKMSLKENQTSIMSEESNSTTDTADVVIETIESFNLNDELGENSGTVPLEIVNDKKRDENNGTDVESLSAYKVNDEAVTSTPYEDEGEEDKHKAGSDTSEDSDDDSHPYDDMYGSMSDFNDYTYEESEKESEGFSEEEEEEEEIHYNLINIPDNLEYVDVEVTASDDGIEFYVQLQRNKHCKNIYYCRVLYDRLMRELQEDVYKQPPLTIFERNTPCCAKLRDGRWSRCIIAEHYHLKDSNGTRIKLLFVDFGYEEVRTVYLDKDNELYEIKPEWKVPFVMMARCRMSNVDKNFIGVRPDLLRKLANLYGRPVRARITANDSELLYLQFYADDKCTELLYNDFIEQLPGPEDDDIQLLKK